MKRVIDTLNEMSFELPEGWQVTKDRYELANGQGFINKENYLSTDGKVISLFEVHRDPDEFLENYQSLAESYKQVTDKFELEEQFNLKLNDFVFPVFVIKGYRDKLIYIVQAFINCGDCLGCLMIYINKFVDSPKELMKREPLFNTLVKILRTVE